MLFRNRPKSFDYRLDPPDDPIIPHEDEFHCLKCHSWQAVRFEAKKGSFIGLRCGHGHNLEILQLVKNHQIHQEREDGELRRAEMRAGL